MDESFWLEDEDSLDFVDKALTSERYLTRWAVLEILDRMARRPQRDSPEEHLRNRALTQLLRDPHPRVRAEAEYRQAILDHEANAAATPKAERRVARREIERQRPALVFERLETLFHNHLHGTGRKNYTVSELDEFVQRQPI